MMGSAPSRPIRHASHHPPQPRKSGLLPIFLIVARGRRAHASSKNCWINAHTAVALYGISRSHRSGAYTGETGETALDVGRRVLVEAVVDGLQPEAGQPAGELPSGTTIYCDCAGSRT